MIIYVIVDWCADQSSFRRKKWQRIVLEVRPKLLPKQARHCETAEHQKAQKLWQVLSCQIERKNR